MSVVKYNVYVIIDGNSANLNSNNLRPWGEINFPHEIHKNQQVNVNYKNGEELLTILFFRVVEIIKTSAADKLIMIETGREERGINHRT
ncbi:hypothetical protein KAJ41_03185 [Candidatus Parcubacteria bacterium]|nr:hypothetical protein [Candidatus Parcubacteria bacterium]